MTDSVDTDALRRDARILAPGFPGVEQRLNAAADEVDRLRDSRDTWKRLACDERDVTDKLRAVIENAPHAVDCKRGGSGNLRVPCTCWKADAL